jgi:hypothetical protein
MLRNAGLIIIGVILVGIPAFAGGTTETADFPVPAGYSSVSDKGLVFQWKVEGQSLHVRVAAGTDGWVAVGFDPSSRMKDANFLIGYVEDGQANLRDDFGTGGSSHDSDESLGGTSDFSNLDGAEEEGLTWLSFTIPLDSGDRYDRPLAAGNSYTVILAAGSSDGYGGYHGGKRASVTMRL